jgi:acyl-CoA thioesterase FadM
MPFVHMKLDFRAPLRPDDEVLTTVLLDKVGHTSIGTRVVGRRHDGVVSFEGRFVQVFVGADMGKREAPAELVERLAAERALGEEV